MRAGKLRHRLVIQAKNSGSPSRSSTGAAAATWATLVTVWGSFEPLSGKRLEAAKATWQHAMIEAKVRYRSEILDADTAGTPLRISFSGRIYPIGKVLNIEERNIELRLICGHWAALG